MATDAGGRVCAERLARQLGETAFRRTLADSEVTALLAVYDAGVDTGTDGDSADRFRAGVDWLTRAIAQSPHFIYRMELGAPGATGTFALTPDELASALSFTVVASGPDAALRAAAAAGQLGTPEQRSAQLQRLAAARPERFKAQVRRFITEWLQIDFARPSWAKSTAMYPTFSAAMRTALDAQTGLFIDDWAASPTLGALLTSGDVFVNDLTAPLYGLAATGSSHRKVAAPAGQRAGLLTQPGFLGTHAHVDGSSPIFRGVTVMKSVLCVPLPNPPANVPPLPPADPGMPRTTREQVEQHIAAGGLACSGCHNSINPMGFAFEGYDGLGQFRTHENGFAVDTSGAIVGTPHSDRPVANALEMAAALAASADVQRCFSTQVFRYTFGRRETADDRCALEQVSKRFVDSGLDVKALLSAIAENDSFALRKAAP